MQGEQELIFLSKFPLALPLLKRVAVAYKLVQLIRREKKVMGIKSIYCESNIQQRECYDFLVYIQFREQQTTISSQIQQIIQFCKIQQSSNNLTQLEESLIKQLQPYVCLYHWLPILYQKQTIRLIRYCEECMEEDGLICPLRAEQHQMLKQEQTEWLGREIALLLRQEEGNQ